MKLSPAQLSTKLIELYKGSDFVSIETSTEADMKKTNNPYYGKVKKVSRMLVNIGYNYTNSVNNRKEKEHQDRDFVAQKRTWGVAIPDSPLIFHNNQSYLNCQVLKHYSTTYMMDDKEIDKSHLEPYLKEVKSSNTQGVENEVIVRAFKLSSITKMKIRQQEFDIV